MNFIFICFIIIFYIFLGTTQTSGNNKGTTPNVLFQLPQPTPPAPPPTSNPPPMSWSSIVKKPPPIDAQQSKESVQSKVKTHLPLGTESKSNKHSFKERKGSQSLVAKKPFPRQLSSDKNTPRHSNGLFLRDSPNKEGINSKSSPITMLDDIAVDVNDIWRVNKSKKGGRMNRKNDHWFTDDVIEYYNAEKDDKASRSATGVPKDQRINNNSSNNNSRSVELRSGVNRIHNLVNPSK